MKETPTDGSEPGEGPDDLPLTRFLTYRFSRVQAKLNAQATRLLHKTAGLGLTQWRILALIGNSGGQARASDIKNFAAIDKGLFSRQLKVLVEDGLVTTLPDKKDQRVQKLSLTAKGRRLYDTTLPVMRARQGALRSHFDEDELRALYAALDKLEKAAEVTEFDV